MSQLWQCPSPQIRSYETLENGYGQFYPAGCKGEGPRVSNGIGCPPCNRLGEGRHPPLKRDTRDTPKIE